MSEGERDSIWSIRPGMRTAYFLLFMAFFGTGLGLLAIMGGQSDQTLTQTIMTKWVQAGSVAIASAAAAMSLAEIGGSAVVLVEWARDLRDSQRKALRDEGRVAERRAWLDWYERHQSAKEKGDQFNEPPPGDG